VVLLFARVAIHKSGEQRYQQSWRAKHPVKAGGEGFKEGMTEVRKRKKCKGRRKEKALKGSFFATGKMNQHKKTDDD